MNKEKILFIVTRPIVTMEWLLWEGKFETMARILGMRLATARLLPSFVTIARSIFSLFTLSVNFLKKAEYNGNRRDENVFTVNCRR